MEMGKRIFVALLVASFVFGLMIGAVLSDWISTHDPVSWEALVLACATAFALTYAALWFLEKLINFSKQRLESVRSKHTN